MKSYRMLWQMMRPRRCGVLPVLICVLLTAALASWFGFDQRAVSWVVRSGIDPDSNRWIDAFTLLGKAWLQIWLLLLWFVVSGRRRDVLAAVLALILVAVSVGPLKLAVGRVRPYTIVKAQEADHAEHQSRVPLSFPSGDTAAAFGVAAVIAPTVQGPAAVILLGASALVGGLRVTALAHYPSDVLAGAALGLLAGWLATRFVDRRGPADRALPHEGWLVWGGIVGLPLGVCLPHGTNDFLLFLETYGAAALCVLAVRFRELWQGTARDVLLPFLAKYRQAIVSLAVVAVIIENVLHRHRPHELLPFDESFSLSAAAGAALVVMGVLLKYRVAGRAAGPLRGSGRWSILRMHGNHVGPLLIVCGLLMQLDHWMNWLIVVPLFVLCYGASFAGPQESSGSVAPRAQDSAVSGVVPISSPFAVARPWFGRLGRPALGAATGQAWISLAIICLPLLLELLVEDFVFETLLHMP